ncbi:MULTISPECIES: hypothetical protein [Burkholderia]|uniref:Uncharacterized protein n=1 Tax=Burkholderia aenigmatica TaxID=2015348 RepID=A0A6J5JLK9_9BURK|nr:MULTISPECIES: hypothetical protein [Burkholderia]CAB3972350.1 hypothetical protein BLA3211_06924 [Burkholderia aenigmatica]
MALKLANNAVSKLASGVGVGATSIALVPGDGAKYPTLGPGDWFPLTVVKSDGTLEVMRCTARATDTLTVSRAQENTAAQAFSAGDRVELRFTMGAFGALAQLDSPVFTGVSSFGGQVDFTWGLGVDPSAAQIYNEFGKRSLVFRTGAASNTKYAVLGEDGIFRFTSQIMFVGGLGDDPSASQIYNENGKRSIVLRTGNSPNYKYTLIDESGILHLSGRPDWGATPWDSSNFNPATASVSYANSAGSAGSANTANSANYASSAGTAGSVGGVSNPATAGSTCQPTGETAEFGPLSQPAGTNTVDCPDSWVMTGIRTDSWDQNAAPRTLFVRAKRMRNQ